MGPMETWRPIPGYDGRYEISNLGRVVSYAQSKPRVLQQTVHKQGYPRVTLWKSGIGRPRTIHSLLMLAFVGPRPDGMVVRHLDDDPSNNALSNLAYGTHSENTQDMIRNGKCVKLNQTHCVHGHLYDTANTYRRPDGRRKCRTCNRERERGNH
jgi:hypothetical protein